MIEWITRNRPEVAEGDVIERECPSGFCDNGTERGYGFECTTCNGKTTVVVRLNADPTFVRSTVPGWGHWRCTGDIIPQPERTP